MSENKEDDLKYRYEIAFGSRYYAQMHEITITHIEPLEEIHFYAELGRLFPTFEDIRIFSIKESNE